MCSSVSSLPQVVHSHLEWRFSMFSQYLPILCVPCIDLYRKSRIFSLIGWLFRLRHIDSSVSRSPFCCWMSVLIASRFLVVDLRDIGFSNSLKPLYARACVTFDSFAPCTSKWAGTSSEKSSGSSLSAPCFARASHFSLPSSPLWPLTHLKVVGADRFLRRYAALLNQSLFLTSIHPLSSHSVRCLVRPSMMYLESVIISRGI